MSTFAKALTYYLAVKGKTQQDLINDLHYSSSTVSQWCTGKNTPRMDRIEAVATYLGIDATDLLRYPEIFSGWQLYPVMSLQDMLLTLL